MDQEQNNNTTPVENSAENVTPVEADSIKSTGQPKRANGTDKKTNPIKPTFDKAVDFCKKHKKPVIIAIAIILILAIGLPILIGSLSKGGNTYTLTVETGTGGTVEIVGSSTVFKEYKANESVTVKATPDANYDFVQWNKDGELFSINPNCTFRMPENDLKLTANFAAKGTTPIDSTSGLIFTEVTINGVDGYSVEINTDQASEDYFWLHYDKYISTSGSSAILTIPSTYNGKNVLRIANNGYKDLLSFDNIILPRNLVEIGDRAFTRCTDLRAVSLPDSVVSIEPYAFYGCTALMTFPSTNNSSLESVGDYAFYNCSNLITFYFSTGLKTIGDYAFYKTKLNSVNIHSGALKSIGVSAFGYCSLLSYVELPDSLTSIGNHAFENCTSLTSITIPSSVSTMGMQVFCATSSQYLWSITITVSGKTENDVLDLINSNDWKPDWNRRRDPSWSGNTEAHNTIYQG
jgi:hypothetical protein